MEFLLGYEILESYKRLSYKEWYAFAEFVDNSTQSFRNNKDALLKALKNEGNLLTVSITYSNAKKKDFIQIEDNAMGMDLRELTQALILGKKPAITDERSKYGLGLKTAAFWFGDKWSVVTTKLGSDKKFSVDIELNKILIEERKFYEKLRKAGKDETKERFIPKLKFEESKCGKNEHGTTIHITQLNRKITSTKAKRCKDYLRSIYRIDLSKKELSLLFQKEELIWNQDEILNRILIDKKTGDKYFHKFNFKINKKKVHGWAGILKHGSRMDAGFSLIQAERVIQGWPNSYRPTKLFGDQEGGINDLVNQRLFGEIYLDGFEVSHTKDEILFQEDEEIKLDDALFKQLAIYKKVAEEFRLKNESGDNNDEIHFEAVVDSILKNFKDPAFKSVVYKKDILPVKIIEKTNSELYERILRSEHSTFEAKIDKLIVSIIISDDSSPFDPYLLIRARSDKNKLTIVINKRHSYWNELISKESVYSFIKNCIYDGISEWKAYFIADSLDPDTIKLIKDHLLRVKMELPF